MKFNIVGDGEAQPSPVTSGLIYYVRTGFKLVTALLMQTPSHSLLALFFNIQQIQWAGGWQADSECVVSIFLGG